MGLNERLDLLFERYKADGYTGSSFFPDGIIDEKRYISSDPKILFLLKDPNADDEEEGDLREWIRDFAEEFARGEKLFQIWKNAGKLAYLIHSGLPSYNVVYGLSRRNIADEILSLAVVNLKKSGGEGVSRWKPLYTAAKIDFNLWEEEIDIINPDMVICGGTYGIAANLFIANGVIDEDMLKESSSGMPYFMYKGKVFIDFLHPLFRGLRFSAAYSYLKEGIREILG